MLKVIKTVLAEGKADNVVALSATRQSSGLFAWMVVATAGSSRHTAALTARLLKALKSAGFKKPSVEAAAGGEWTLVDCSDVVVQIMREETRQYYRLEELWGFESGAPSLEAH